MLEHEKKAVLDGTKSSKNILCKRHHTWLFVDRQQLT